ncbi:MAG: DUF3857 domain-containing protein [Cyclobacteriaceae bacterium]|nr:DUF3857 domain-containing protein [Cyclobacteriaceae bacterium]
MKRLLVLMLLPLAVFAQKRPPIKFGNVSMEEMNMTVYEKDSSAIAVKLFDIGESSVNGIKSTYKRHTRIKILKEEGLQYGSVVVPFFSLSSFFGDVGTFTGLKAVTYNLDNGRMVESKLESQGKFKEEFVDGIRVIRFALPQVKVGSVIEYQYEVQMKMFFELRSWDFQDLIPCRWSEYQVHISNVCDYRIVFRGYLVPSVNEKKDGFCEGLNSAEARTLNINPDHLDDFKPCVNYRWAMADVPAFKEEPFISSRKNYISSVSFDLASIDYPGGVPRIVYMSSWGDVREKYLDEIFKADWHNLDVKTNTRRTEFLEKKAQEVVAGLSHPDEKVKAIYHYVKENLEWAGYYSTYLARDPKKVWEEKKGSSGDVNLLLLSMLRYAGLPADPVLISTRSNGFVREMVPVRSQFNNVVVISDYKGKKKILDATDRYLPIEYIPLACLNGIGFQPTDKAFQWVNLLDAPKSRKSVTMDVYFSDDNTLKGTFTSSSTGYYARDVREAVRKSGMVKHLDNVFKGKTVTIADTVMENLDKLDDPLKETYKLELADIAQSGGDVIYLDPILFTRRESNPFVQLQRTYPVDFSYPQEIAFMMKLKLPENYTVDELPAPKVSMLPENAGRFVYSSSVADGAVTIMSQFVINKVLFSQDEYDALREFYNIMLAKHNEQLVLKRK